MLAESEGMRPEETIGTGRLLLSPLGPADADEMAEVLADPRLYQFIGGHPATLEGLRARYAALAAGPGRPGEVWCNWVVRRRADARPVGTVQATLARQEEGRWSAAIAWVIGVRWQRQGYATEAARALVAWLERRGVQEIVAHVHPGHRASAQVAARAGLRPTADRVDGEQVWRRAGTQPAEQAPRSPAAAGAAGSASPERLAGAEERPGQGSPALRPPPVPGALQPGYHRAAEPP